jgi:hypothetical protein
VFSNSAFEGALKFFVMVISKGYTMTPLENKGIINEQ